MNRITFGKSIGALGKSMFLWVLAALSSCAAAIHVVSGTVVAAATYFTAWATRMQHKLISFFTRYGASIGESGATPSVRETHEHFVAQLSDAELETEQQGDSAETSSPWTPDPESKSDETSGLFGTTPPRGQA